MKIFQLQSSILLLVLLASDVAIAQQTSNPLARLQQLSRRVKQKFEHPEQQRAESPNHYPSNNNIRSRIPNNYNSQVPIVQASRIGVNENHRYARPAAYYQQSNGIETHDNSGWPTEPVLSDQPPVQQYANARMPMGDNQSSSVYSNQLPQAPVAQGSSSRMPPVNYSTNYDPRQQNHAHPVNNYEQAGIVGVHDSGRRGRFPHFTSRIPASERVVMLEDKLAIVDKKLNSALVENKLLQGRLDENERLLVEIQASIDEAITQLTDAATVNQELREKIVRLETEKRQQKESYSKVMDNFQGKLEELLQAEIAGK